MNSLQLFLSQVKSAPESSRVKVLQIVFDILMTYEKDILGKPEHIVCLFNVLCFSCMFNAATSQGQRVIAFIMQVLETEDSKAIQALICLGLSKLMLFGLVTDERVNFHLKKHIFYLHDACVGSNRPRPCICFSSYERQSRAQAVSCLFFPPLLLFFNGKPTQDAIGTRGLAFVDFIHNHRYIIRFSLLLMT